MQQPSRIFDLLSYQLEKFPKKDMFGAKEHGQWKPEGPVEVRSIVDQLATGLLKIGIGGNDMTIEKQDKIALISRNCPEWMFLDLACQQTGAVLCPIYPTTNTPELEFIFNDASIKYVFVCGNEILHKVQSIKDR